MYSPLLERNQPQTSGKSDTIRVKKKKILIQ